MDTTPEAWAEWKRQVELAKLAPGQSVYSNFGQAAEYLRQNHLAIIKELLDVNEAARLTILALEKTRRAIVNETVQQCAEAVRNERVDAEATGEKGDVIYNEAIYDAEQAILALREPEGT